MFLESLKLEVSLQNYLINHLSLLISILNQLLQRSQLFIVNKTIFILKYLTGGFHFEFKCSGTNYIFF